jgi:hypothetical protein
MCRKTLIDCPILLACEAAVLDLDHFVLMLR